MEIRKDSLPAEFLAPIVDLMKVIFRLFLLVVTFALLMTACGGETTPTLAVVDQPTLVFVYTDG